MQLKIFEELNPATIQQQSRLDNTPIVTRIFYAVSVCALLYFFLNHIGILARVRIVLTDSSEKQEAKKPVPENAIITQGEPEIDFTEDEKTHDQARKEYIARFARIAQAEQKKYGIPASITIAQGLLESNAGRSKLAEKANNHFGIKCFSRSCHSGHCMNITDDTHKDFFKIFPSAWSSYRAHSELLMRQGYSKCRQCGEDWQCWAKKLKECGYATDPGYTNGIIRIIKLYRLYKYDTADTALPQ